MRQTIPRMTEALRGAVRAGVLKVVKLASGELQVTSDQFTATLDLKTGEWTCGPMRGTGWGSLANAIGLTFTEAAALWAGDVPAPRSPAPERPAAASEPDPGPDTPAAPAHAPQAELEGLAVPPPAPVPGDPYAPLLPRLIGGGRVAP